MTTDAFRTPWLFINRLEFWRIATWVTALVVIIPLTILGVAWLHPESEIWRHLTDTVLGSLLMNTMYLVLGVGFGVFLLGVGLAALTALCDFPGRRLFDWALMLPLAVPAYVLAFVAVGFLDFAGPLQTWLRDVFGDELRLPSIQSTGGVIAIMSLVFYPYVYMLARTAFLAQGHTLIEAARNLGMTPFDAFLRVVLPMARPAIAAGMSLALMETLADFGAMSVFNYDTFTTAIYKAWFGFYNLNAASQLASLLLLFVLAGLLIERKLRRRARYYQPGRVARFQRTQLTGIMALLATLAAGLVLLLALILPVIQLVLWASESLSNAMDPRYLELLWHTVQLGLFASVLTVVVALLLVFARHRYRDVITQAAVRIATLGYALPGSVLAVGIMVSFVWMDSNAISPLLVWLGFEEQPLLVGSLLGLLLAYLVRFLTVGFGPVDSAFDRLRPSLLEAARGLGAHHRDMLQRIYLPLLKPGLMTAVLLVLVDVMKEMPATLLLRPFGWDTLAVRIFEMTSEGEWERAALPALTLILIGFFPVLLLVRRSGRH